MPTYWYEPSEVNKASGWESTGSNSIIVEIDQGVRPPATPALKGAKHVSNPLGSGSGSAYANNRLSLYVQWTAQPVAPTSGNVWAWTNGNEIGASLEFSLGIGAGVIPHAINSGGWKALPLNASQLEAIYSSTEHKAPINMTAIEQPLGLVVAAALLELVYPETAPSRIVMLPSG